LASTFGLVSDLSCGAEPPWSWKRWTYSSRVLGGKPVATNSSSLLMSELFLQRRAEDDLIGTFEFVTIDSSAMTNVPAL
jgi:hypothetical protein